MTPALFPLSSLGRERNDSSASPVVDRDRLGNGRQTSPDQTERKSVFALAPSDVKQSVPDFELGHIFDERRRTHTTLSPLRGLHAVKALRLDPFSTFRRQHMFAAAVLYKIFGAAVEVAA